MTEHSAAYKDIDKWASVHLRKWITDVIWRVEAVDLPVTYAAEIVLLNLILEMAMLVVLLEKDGVVREEPVMQGLQEVIRRKREHYAKRESER